MQRILKIQQLTNKQPNSNMGKETQQTFLQKDTQMTNKYIKDPQHHLGKYKSKLQYHIIS